MVTVRNTLDSNWESSVIEVKQQSSSVLPDSRLAFCKRIMKVFQNEIAIIAGMDQEIAQAIIEQGVQPMSQQSPFTRVLKMLPLIWIADLY